MRSKTTSLVFVFLLAINSLLASTAHANPPRSLLDSLIDGVLRPEVYSGFMGKIQPLKPTWFCDDNRYFWSLNWRAELDTVDVNFDIENPDVTSVHIRLKDSSLRAQYYQRGGWTCSWDGANGAIAVGQIDLSFNLYASDERDFPRMTLESLKLKDLEISDVDVMYASVFSTGFRNSSEGFADWVENNLNSIFKHFLSTELKKRFDDVLNKEVDRRLREREESISHP